MPQRISALILLALAFIAHPVSALPTSCPEGIEVSKSAIKSVDDIFRIRVRHRGEQINFSDIVLAHADFSGRDVSNLCFNQSQLIHSNWTGAKGSNVQFHGTDLTGSLWNRFRGERLGFHYSKLDGARLARSVMRKSTFDRTGMLGIEASNADLSGGSLRGNALDSLHNARFDSANMTGFEFRCGIGQEDNCGQSSSNVSLAGANLTDAAILMGSKSDWDLKDAVLDNTRLHFPQLDWIRESQIAGPVIVEPTAWSPASYFSDHLIPVSLSLAELKKVWSAFDRLDEPGFNCGNSLSPAEHYICRRSYGSPEESYEGPLQFAEADRELNQAYVLAWRKDRSIVPGQRLWLRERDACIKLETGWPRDDCIATAYRDRIEELWRIAGMEATILPGESRWFVDRGTGEFLWRIEDGELRSKLAPAALGNSWEIVVIERDRDGRLMARGSAVGSNYHLGDLSSPENGMVFDPVSGFYGEREPCLPGYALCPIVRFRGRYLDAGPESSSGPEADEYHFNEYISSGARAGFGRLVAVPIKESGR